MTTALFRQTLTLIAFCLLPSAGAANAQEDEPEELEEVVEEPADEEAHAPDVFTMRVLLGLDTEFQRNFDVDDDEDADVRSFEPMLRFSATYMPNEIFSLFLEAELKANFEREENEGSENEPSLDINQAYVAFGDVIVDDFTVRLGRDLHRDDREWLLDENLDGIRVLYEGSKLEFDISATRQDIVQRDLFDRDSIGDPPIDNYVFIGSCELFDEFRLGGYAVMRDDRSFDNEEGQPIHLGLRTRGELFENFEHWTDFATVQGHDGENDLNGYAVALGGTYTLADVPMTPRMTLGYAWGSGDSNPDDGTNREFRQTGLQSNEGTFGDSAKFKYYGEMLDPELSNLHILSAGIGINPTDKLSLDLVYHRYRQDVRSDELRDVAVDLDPNEDDDRLSKDIGDEIDLVIGYQLTEAIELVFSAGYFMPGGSFRFEGDGDKFENADDAFFARFEVDVRF